MRPAAGRSDRRSHHASKERCQLLMIYLQRLDHELDVGILEIGMGFSHYGGSQITIRFAAGEVLFSTICRMRACQPPSSACRIALRAVAASARLVVGLS